MADELAVFGPNGKLMGNLTSSFGIPAANVFPDIPSLPALPNIPGTQTASNVSPGQTTGTPTAPAPSQAGDLLSIYFVRGVVVILGFIFVAVGLTMFSAKTSAGREVIRTIKNHPSLAP